MFRCTVPVGHGKPVFDGVLSQSIVFRIADLLIYNGLHTGILRRVDAESAAEQQIAGLGIRVAQLLLQGLCHLINKLVCVVGVGGIVLLCSQIYILDAGVHIVCQSLLLFLLRDISLIVHLLKNRGPPLRIVLSSGNWTQAGGIFRDGSDDCALRERQV